MIPRNVKFRDGYKADFVNAIGPVGALGFDQSSSLDDVFRFFSQNMDKTEMPSVKELRERRGVLNQELQALVNTATAENRNLTAEESEQFRKNKAEDQEIVSQIELEQAKTEAVFRNGTLSQAMSDIGMPGMRVLHNGGGGIISSGFSGYVANDLDKAVAAFGRNSHGRPVPADEWEAANRMGYQPGGAGMDIYMNALRPGRGRDLNFFGPQNSMVSIDTRRGGALAVGAGFGPSVEWGLKSSASMVNVADVWVSPDGLPRPIPTIDDTDQFGELIGEGNEASEGDIEAGATIVDVYKMSSKIVRVTAELLDDAPQNLAAEIGLALGTRIGRGMNRILTVSDSPNAPRGIVPSAFVGKQTASSTVLTADEIIDLTTALDPIYQSSPRCAFMMSPAVFGMIQKLRDAEDRFLMGTLENGATPKLRGWDVILNPQMPTVLSAGVKPILFGDWSKFKIRIVRQIRLRTLVEKYATTDETGFLAFLRFGGVLLDAGTHPIQALQMKPA